MKKKILAVALIAVAGWLASTLTSATPFKPNEAQAAVCGGWVFGGGEAVRYCQPGGFQYFRAPKL